jgi:hypothetical protein
MLRTVRNQRRALAHVSAGLRDCGAIVRKQATNNGCFSAELCECGNIAHGESKRRTFARPSRMPVAVISRYYYLQLKVTVATPLQLHAILEGGEH